MKGSKSIAQLLSNLSSEQVIDFIEGILTPHEITQIVMRIKIVQMLKKDIPQHKIAFVLGIGVATVSRGAKMLKNGKLKYVE